MKTFITSSFLGLFCLIFSNHIYAQCRFTRVNTTDCECITLLLDANPDAITDEINYGDGQIESVLNQSVAEHCYASPGSKTVRRTVTRDGLTCRSTQTLTVVACCPQIQNINLIYMGTNGSPSCAPGLKSSDTTIISSNLLSAYYCYPKFTAILNSSNLNGYTYGWYFTYWSSDGGSLGTICEVPNTITAHAPALMVPGGRTVLLGVNFFIEGQGCPRTELNKTLVVEYPCQSNYTFGLKPDDKQLEEYFLKKHKTNNILLVYPNPTKDQIKLDIPDNDIYSFEIYNTLGQTVLNQQVSLETSSVSLSNLQIGVYIGVLKSKDKIIHTEKIYKQ